MKVTSIPLKEILPDFFFCFSNSLESPALSLSIKESGIRSPLWVLPARSGFRIVSGFRRYWTALVLDLSALPCIVLSESIPLEDHFLHVLLEQTTIRSLHLLEKAKAIRILRRIGLNGEKIATQFSPVLELPSKISVIDSVYETLSFSPQFQNYLTKYPISLKQVKAFHQFSLEEQTHLAYIGETLAIRIVELSEIAESILEIGKKENRPITTIMKECIDSSLNETEWTREEKIQKIKTELENRRFPKRNFWNLQIKKIQEGLALPPSLTLRWDFLLEEPGFLLQMRITKKEQIDEIGKFFSSETHREKLKSILDWV